jgi:pimeloyl-ACP methyl ester carboxylesterase
MTESGNVQSRFEYQIRKWKRGVSARLALLSRRFDPLLKAEEPLARMEYRDGAPAEDLIVFLPGIGDVADDFERQGFIADIRGHGIVADAVAVDAHYGYYASRTIHTRIAEDVVASAREIGYERIWLAGISLGGFGAASYAAIHGAHIAGLLLFAPYLGGKELVQEIKGAGGVGNWEPGERSAEDYPRALWTWLKNNARNRDAGLPIYLGYGNSDMFRNAHALLADLLPENRVHCIPGGHDWRTWRRLWQAMLPAWRRTSFQD